MRARSVSTAEAHTLLHSGRMWMANLCFCLHRRSIMFALQRQAANCVRDLSEPLEHILCSTAAECEFYWLGEYGDLTLLTGLDPTGGNQRNRKDKHNHVWRHSLFLSCVTYEKAYAYVGNLPTCWLRLPNRAPLSGSVFQGPSARDWPYIYVYIYIYIYIYIWFMVYGIWYMVYGIWYMVYGIWYSL